MCCEVYNGTGTGVEIQSLFYGAAFEVIYRSYMFLLSVGGGSVNGYTCERMYCISKHNVNLFIKRPVCSEVHFFI